MENMEIYWEVLMHAGRIVNIIIAGSLLHRFVKPFFEEGKHTYAVGIAYMLTMLLLDFIPYEMRGMTAYAIGTFISFLVMFYIDRRNIEQKIFLAVMFYLMDWIVWGLALFPWNVSYRLITVPVDLQWQLGMYLVRQLLFYLTGYFILSLIIKVIHKAYGSKKENLTKRELILMLAPFLSIVAGRILFSYFSDIYLNDFNTYIWNNHAEYDWIQLLYQAVSLASMFTVIIIYQNIKAGQKREKEEAVLLNQIEDMERHIHGVETLYQEIRGLKHDMGNHVTILENLYGRDEEAGKYLARLKEQVLEVTGEVKSGNPVTDVILRENKKEAEKKGIEFQYEFYYPEGTDVSAFDVSIILNNLINNAMEAAEECEKPYIRILSYHRENAYMIEVKNSVMGKRMIDEESGLPATTKKGSGHGFGLPNVQKVARKYYGDVEIGQNGNEFVVVVMLMME